eukprot:3139399-Rhodomonas_salina.1
MRRVALLSLFNGGSHGTDFKEMSINMLWCYAEMCCIAVGKRRKPMLDTLMAKFQGATTLSTMKR